MALELFKHGQRGSYQQRRYATKELIVMSELQLYAQRLTVNVS